jgi:hypothetical protein
MIVIQSGAIGTSVMTNVLTSIIQRNVIMTHIAEENMILILIAIMHLSSPLSCLTTTQRRISCRGTG